MLMNKITREVNVEDYGAVPDGRDNTESFGERSGTAGQSKCSRRRIFGSRDKTPSWTTISGEGQGITVLKLHEDTPASEWVITNDDYENGNRNIFVENMTLDWNPDRQCGVRNPGGQFSSCLTFAMCNTAGLRMLKRLTRVSMVLILHSDLRSFA